MAKIISDKAFINDNILRHEKRLESQYTIYLDKTPTFVTYYHIDDKNSSVDVGLQNIDQIVGKDSPLKFNTIKDFPIYGLDQIELQLQDEEEGLTVDFEGDGIILPNTLKPYPNDHFVISYLGKNYLFMVNNVSYDTIKSNNFYKITFHLKANDETAIVDLDKQVMAHYSTIFKNIGTEDRCILRDDEIDKYNELSRLYEAMMDKYITYFYSEKYNSLIKPIENGHVYDKYLTHFIQSNNLLSRKETYETFMLANEDWDPNFDFEYDSCIYSCIENKDPQSLDYVNFLYVPITYKDSRFQYWRDSSIKSIEFIDFGNDYYLDTKIVDAIKSETTDKDTDHVFTILLESYFSGKITSIYQIPLTQLKLWRISKTGDDYIKIPIVLFILRYYAERFMSVKYNS